MSNVTIRLRNPRSLMVLVMRWLVLLVLGLIVVVPVYLHGGAWIPLSILASVYLLACAIVIGIEYFSVDIIEFKGDFARFESRTGAKELPLDSLFVSEPFMLRLFKGRGLLVKEASNRHHIALLLGERKPFEKAKKELVKRIEDSSRAGDSE